MLKIFRINLFILLSLFSFSNYNFCMEGSLSDEERLLEEAELWLSKSEQTQNTAPKLPTEMILHILISLIESIVQSIEDPKLIIMARAKFLHQLTNLVKTNKDIRSFRPILIRKFKESCAIHFASDLALLTQEEKDLFLANSLKSDKEITDQEGVLIKVAGINEIQRIKAILSGANPNLVVDYKMPAQNMDQVVGLQQRQTQPMPILLQCLLKHRDIEAILLIDYGADLNIADSFGNTPLMLVCSKDFLGSLLPSKFEKLKFLDLSSCNPLVYLFELLIRKLNVSQINAQNNQGQTALMKACKSYKTKSNNFSSCNMSELIASNNDILEILTSLNQKRKELSRVPKKERIHKDAIKKVRLLLEKNANVNICDNNNHTALIYAVKRGSKKIVRLLIRHGALVNIKTKKGKSALDKANKKGYTDIANILREAQKTQESEATWCLLS